MYLPDEAELEKGRERSDEEGGGAEAVGLPAAGSAFPFRGGWHNL